MDGALGLAVASALAAGCATGGRGPSDPGPGSGPVPVLMDGGPRAPTPRDEDAGPKDDAGGGGTPRDGGSIFVGEDSGPTAGPRDAGPSSGPPRDAGPTPVPMPGCEPTDLGSRLGMAVAMGSTAAASHRFAPTCSSGTAQDLAYRWQAPRAGTFTFDTIGSGFDTVLAVLDRECTGREMGCNDDAVGLQSVLRVPLTAMQTVVVVVDGYGTRSGDFVLNINEAPEVEDGLCTNMLDDDRDGDSDCDDVDCDTATTCAPPACTGAGCPGMDLGMAVGMLAMGTTAGGCDHLRGGCGSTGGEDLAFTWRAPAAGTYVFDTAGSAFDTVLHARDATCTGRELACNDDISPTTQSRITLSLTAGQTIILVVDGYDAASAGAFRLNVTRGTTSEAGMCTNGLDDDGDTRRDCDDPDCAMERTCMTTGGGEVCYDGRDDDGDGLTDCADPDCTGDWSCP